MALVASLVRFFSFGMCCVLCWCVSWGQLAMASDHPTEASEHHSESVHSDLPEAAAKQSSRDTRVPHALVGRIEKEYREFLKKNEVSEKTSVQRKLLNIKVELTQKKVAALQGDVRIVTPLGGGVIDLSEYVTPVKGAFQLRFDLSHDDGGEIGAVRAFYVSDAKVRNLDGERFGAGCGKFMEITSEFQRKMSKTGWDLYTLDQRYLSAVGGTFLFFEFTKEALYVGSVKFEDSRYPEYLCE